MPYYIDKQGGLHFLSDDDVAKGSESLLPADSKPATDKQVIAAQMKAATPDLRIEAQAALLQSDITVLRCYEAGLSLPAEWRTYRAALRAIVSAPDASAMTLPVRPAYPDAA